MVWTKSLKFICQILYKLIWSALKNTITTAPFDIYPENTCTGIYFLVSKFDKNNPINQLKKVINSYCIL